MYTELEEKTKNKHLLRILSCFFFTQYWLQDKALCTIDKYYVNSKLHSKEVFEGDFLEKEGPQLSPERQVGFGKVGERWGRAYAVLQ